MTHYQQNMPNRCGPTAVQVVVKKLKGTYKTQCEYYRDAFNLVSPAACPDNVLSRTNLRNALDLNVSHSGSWVSGAMTWVQLKENIDDGEPLIAYVRTNIKRAGDGYDHGLHFITIYGYSAVDGVHYVHYSNYPILQGTGTSAKVGKMTMANFKSDALTVSFNPQYTLINIHN